MLEQKEQSNITSINRTHVDIFTSMPKESQLQQSVNNASSVTMTCKGDTRAPLMPNKWPVTYRAPADFKKLLAKAMCNTHRALNSKKGDDILLEESRRKKISIEEARKRIFVQVRHLLTKRYFEMVTAANSGSSNSSDTAVNRAFNSTASQPAQRQACIRTKRSQRADPEVGQAPVLCCFSTGGARIDLSTTATVSNALRRLALQETASRQQKRNDSRNGTADIESHCKTVRVRTKKSGTNPKPKLRFMMPSWQTDTKITPLSTLNGPNKTHILGLSKHSRSPWKSGRARACTYALRI